MRHSNAWLKTNLFQAGWIGIKGRDTYLHAQFHRHQMPHRDLAWQVSAGTNSIASTNGGRRSGHRLTQLGCHVEIQERPKRRQAVSVSR